MNKKVIHYFLIMILWIYNKFKFLIIFGIYGKPKGISTLCPLVFNAGKLGKAQMFPVNETCFKSPDFSGQPCLISSQHYRMLADGWRYLHQYVSVRSYVVVWLMERTSEIQPDFEHFTIFHPFFPRELAAISSRPQLPCSQAYLEHHLRGFTTQDAPWVESPSRKWPGSFAMLRRQL